MANLTDNERYLLALTLADALLAEPGPYAAPDRITATAALLAGDFRLALTYLSTRPHSAPGGKDPDHRVLGWWDFAFALACKLEDYALKQADPPAVIGQQIVVAGPAVFGDMTITMPPRR